MPVGFIISNLCLCLQAECDSVVAMSEDRNTAEKNKYCEVFGPGKYLTVPAPPHIELEKRDL